MGKIVSTDTLLILKTRRKIEQKDFIPNPYVLMMLTGKLKKNFLSPVYSLISNKVYEMFTMTPGCGDYSV